MKIAIDARLLKTEPDDGISRFTYEVAKRLLTRHGEHSYSLIFDRKPDMSLTFGTACEILTLKPKSVHPILWYTWHEWQLPQILRKSGADVFWSPDGIISLRSTVPSVPVIHDINFHHRPKDIPRLTGRYYSSFFGRFAVKAARIQTVSEFCRDDIAVHLHVDPRKIDVAYNGVSEYFVPAGEEEILAYRKKITGGTPYFLFVGNFSPRKNIPGLISAYNTFREKSKLNHKLVLAGGRLYLNKETDSLLRSSPFRKDIILTGSLKHRELSILYSSAHALVFVPWFEGFGIPAAEAMKCGTPVILSDTTSLPEVGGEAALYANPGNPAGISDAMIRITGNENLREELRRKGFIQAAKFSWDNSAASVVKSLEKAVQS
jgi:glycosyltransferase involved in cell wall biosynthesis